MTSEWMSCDSLINSSLEHWFAGLNDGGKETGDIWVAEASDVAENFAWKSSVLRSKFLQNMFNLFMLPLLFLNNWYT